MRRAAAVAATCVAAWAIAFATWSSRPAGFDFVALYASARLVATGHPADVVRRAALMAAEHDALPAREVFLNDPNPPALALLMAPLALLPIAWAYALYTALAVAALAAALHLLGDLVTRERRGPLFLLGMLAPTSLIPLAEGQTAPFMLLVLAAAGRGSGARSGALLGLLALRPQLLPLAAVAALAERGRRAAFVAVAGAIALASAAVIASGGWSEGIGAYRDLLGLAAGELRPTEIDAVSLLRRVAAMGDTVSLALSAFVLLAGAVALRRSARRERTGAVGVWTLLGSPHVLLHDAVLAYPALAARCGSRVATLGWIGSGVLAALVHQAGVPVFPLWLAAVACAPLVPRAAARVRRTWSELTRPSRGGRGIRP